VEGKEEDGRWAEKNGRVEGAEGREGSGGRKGRDEGKGKGTYQRYAYMYVPTPARPSSSACQFLTAITANVYVLSAVMRSLYHHTGSVAIPTNVGRFLLLARLSGTLCLKTCGVTLHPECSADSCRHCFYFRNTK